MSQVLKDGMFFAIPFVSTLILSVILGYQYYKDRNKRKLLFAIGIFLTAFGFYNSVITSIGWTPTFPISCWLFMPLALAILIAAMSSFLQIKDFDKPFAIFVVGTAVSLFAFFTQLPFKTIHVAVLISFMSVSVPLLIWLYIKSKNPYDLNFLIGTLCFLFQALVFALGASDEIPVMLTLFGVVFIALMFNGPNVSTSSSMAAFVVLENKLNEANRNLKDIQEKLLKAERLATIGELAGLIGHDLRNPLQGIAGATYYIKTHTAKDVETKEMIENIETCIQRSDKIINDLIEYSQTINIEPVKTNPKLLTERALCQIEIPTNVKVVNFTGAKPDFEVDTERMERVFVSIIKNAFDAMSDGGKLTITCATTKNALVFKFIDTGTGMTPEVLGKLWLPLFTTKAKGMGFGLAICKRIIEAHGGKIDAESVEGKGTTIIVQFPTQTHTLEVQDAWV